MDGGLPWRSSLADLNTVKPGTVRLDASCWPSVWTTFHHPDGSQADGASSATGRWEQPHVRCGSWIMLHPLPVTFVTLRRQRTRLLMRSSEPQLTCPLTF
ncbi:hypothetical protein T06_16600 [Trichinella sp. T6]|nr:hypothetical protein T06_16600 [Trichinella sp. T6]